jgi:flavin reductase (DIM6/NTAB) family NADH-FMN oxidoreductase RutF
MRWWRRHRADVGDCEDRHRKATQTNRMAATSLVRMPGSFEGVPEIVGALADIEGELFPKRTSARTAAMIISRRGAMARETEREQRAASTD